MFYPLVVLVALSRLASYPLNFAPLGVIGVFAGAYFPRCGGWAVPAGW